MSDIYLEIKADHEKHRAILDALDGTTGDSDERRQLFGELKVELTAHANAEEQTLYAELLADRDSQEQARHSVSEHQEADDLLRELEELEFSNPGWLGKFRKLKEELEHHMDEEEKDVFAKAQGVIAKANAEKLGRDFRSRKKREAAEV